MDFIHCNLCTEKNIVLPHINMSLPVKVTPVEIRSLSEKWFCYRTGVTQTTHPQKTCMILLGRLVFVDLTFITFETC